MMQKEIKPVPMLSIMKIENFGDMQARYQTLPLTNRAEAVMSDAEPALAITQKILSNLSKHQKLPQAISNLRSNSFIISRIRPSEAKTVLVDDSVNFIQVANQKLASWHKTLKLIADGKTKAKLVKEIMPEHLSITNISGYLSLVKLVIVELSKLDSDNQSAYDSMLGETRRCATILSDCECASGLNSVVLH